MKPLNINEIIANTDIKYHKYLEQHKIVIFNEIPSTNNYLLECVSKNNNEIIFCLAEKQTAGRARNDRVWFSPIGNIYLSILWQFKFNINQLSGLSLAIAVAVNRTLKKYGINDIKLKWPNDILWQDRKLAGILIETFPANECKDLYNVIIGLGLNIDLNIEMPLLVSQCNNVSPIDLTTITKKTPERNRLIGLLINSILDAIFLFQNNGLQSFIKEWQTADYSCGKLVTISSGENIISGIHRGINEQGYLLLEVILDDSTSKLYTIASGEVSLRIKMQN